jgi:hypothetical protein
MIQKVGSFSEASFSRRLPGVLLLILPLFLAQIALYHRSFGIKPASDDFPIVNEIVRGNQHGPGVFFRESVSNMHHRPFKSLAIWAFGQISDQHREFWIRVLHFIGMACYTTVLALWLTRLNLSLVACFFAASVLLFHPTLPQALASVDGIDGIMASSLLWFGAWIVLVWRDRPAPATLATVVCFLLAAGWKEYSFAIVPLATWTLVCFGGKGAWKRAAALFAVLCVVFVVILFIRQRAMPAGYGTVRGADYASINPIQWAKNAAVMGTGLLFFGNSIWVYVNQSARVLVIVAECIFVALLMIVIGVVGQMKKDSATKVAQPLGSMRAWVVFLLGGFVAASFPANVIMHMSEMYLSPLLLPLALLCGISAEGWRDKGKSARLVACVFATVALISSAFTVHAKVDGIRDVGQRAENQMKQVIDLLPPDAHDVKIAILFDVAELPPKRTYAVYRMGDEVLVVHAMALNWLTPERHLYLRSFPIGHPEFTPGDYDYILKWNPAKQQFEPWQNR